MLVLYQDRQYGDIKCYEKHISESDNAAVLQEFKHVQLMAESNLAPDRLPNNDYMCTNCEYKKKCREWG